MLAGVSVDYYVRLEQAASPARRNCGENSARLAVRRRTVLTIRARGSVAVDTCMGDLRLLVFESHGRTCCLRPGGWIVLAWVT
jgi:hypothetical protein